MTLEQVKTIRDSVFPGLSVTAYGDPRLENGVWKIGFGQSLDSMALDASFADRNIDNEADRNKAEVDLAKVIRGTILMAT